jgi:hypothetical protein
MKIKILIIVFLLFNAFMSTAQTEGITLPDSLGNKHYTPSSPDLPNEFKQISDLSKKYPNRSVFYPEDFGEDLTVRSKQELITRLEISKDSIELRKIAVILGDREMAKTLNLNGSERNIVEKKIRAYILSTSDFYGVNYAEVHDQIIRFWPLAIPEMLSNTDNSNSFVRDFVFNTLMEMRSELVIKSLLERAKNSKSASERERYVTFFRLMNQNFEFLIPNRKCLTKLETDALFTRLVIPVIDELKPK